MYFTYIYNLYVYIYVKLRLNQVVCVKHNRKLFMPLCKTLVKINMN